jgi:hypothetical protein
MVSMEVITSELSLFYSSKGIAQLILRLLVVQPHYEEVGG